MTTPNKPRRSLRNLVLSTHRVVGLSVGLVVVLSALTGAAMAFRKQLEPLAYPRMLQATVCAATHPVDDLVDQARAAYPGGRLSYVRIQNRPGAPWIVRFAGEENVFMDPCTGAALGRQNRYGGLFGTIEAIHQAKYLREGHVLVGSCALAFAVFLIGGGLFMWWPRTHSAIRPAMTLRPDLKGRARLVNLHRTLGAYAAPLLLVSALTSAPQAFSWAKSAVYLASGSRQPSAPAAPTHPSGSNVLPLEQAWLTAQRLSPDPREVLLHAPKRGKAMETFIITADAPHINARTYLYLDPVDGRVLSYRPYATSTLGDKLYYWTLSIHTGKAGGVLGQLLLFCGALALLTLAYAGIAAYLQRTVRRTARPAARPGA